MTKENWIIAAIATVPAAIASITVFANTVLASKLQARALLNPNTNQRMQPRNLLACVMRKSGRLLLFAGVVAALEAFSLSVELRKSSPVTRADIIFISITICSMYVMLLVAALDVAYEMFIFTIEKRAQARS